MLGEKFNLLLQTFEIVEIKSFKVFFFLAIVPTTGTPRILESLSKLTLMPFFLASSNRLTQTITFLVKFII